MSLESSSVHHDFTLQTVDLSRRFGPFMAVDRVSINIKEGEIRAIIGPNGAGKTTFFNLLSGHMPPSHGQVFLKGQAIGGHPPHEVARLGMSRAFQTTNIFPELTVEQNIEIALLGLNRQTMAFWRRTARNIQSQADQYLEMVGLSAQRKRPAGILAHGDQRALEVALALALKPSVLLLDEPTSGMSPFETQKTVELLKNIIAQLKLTVVLSEHDMDVVFGLADRITVMERGRVLAEGNPQEIRTNPEVIRAYLGDDQ